MLGSQGDGLFDEMCAEPSPCCNTCILLDAISVMSMIEYWNIMKERRGIGTWGVPGMGSMRVHAECVSTSPGLFLYPPEPAPPMTIDLP